ncbi:hypothetical protein C7271_15785 [filamentous cyanobacterium CCP5]|nr:hypothetical protein C7271_15785 [filamentous cyanobacterium CCP5]
MPLTELVLSDRRQPLGQIQLDWAPQPGAYLDFAGKTYQVLERHHRYRLRANRYWLHKIILQVKASPMPEQVSRVDHSWVIGEASCRFNARSKLVRCAVNPRGPCEGCNHYQPLSS